MHKPSKRTLCKNTDCPINIGGFCGSEMIRLKHAQRLQEIKFLPEGERLAFEASAKHKSEEEIKNLLEAAKKRSVAVFMMEHVKSNLPELPLL